MIESIHALLDRLLGKGNFQQISADVSNYLREQLLQQGDEAREVVDVLHGKQLGHPLHPALTDVTIGSWTLGVFFDALAFITRSTQARRTGDALTYLGTVTAVPTALAGIADYSGIKKDAAGYAAAHGILNGIAFFCFAASTMARRQRNRDSAFLLSLVGFSTMLASACIGGDMVYRQRVGVNHAPRPELDEWTGVIAAENVKEEKPVRVEADGQPVLLYRKGETIYAIGAVCSHAGGPLEEGKVKDDCVECPWHQSVYDLRDGQLVHGPSAFSQPRYMTRVRRGRVEVRKYVAEEAAEAHVDVDEAPALATTGSNGTVKNARRPRQTRKRSS